MRAAIAADADAAAEDHSQEAVPIPLPGGDRGGAGAPPAATPEASSPGDPITEPIPVIKAPASPATGVPAADVAAAAPEGAAPESPAPAKPETVAAPSQPKAVEAAPQPPSTHRGPRADRGSRASAEAGKSLKGQPRASRSYRMAGVLVTTVTVALLAAGFAVFHHSGGNPAAGNTARGSSAGRSDTRSAGPVDAATLSRNAAAWVAAQVGSANVISCDPAMCQALQARHIPPSRLYVLKPGKTNPLDSTVIVATPILRSQIGSRLTSVYAPGLLARFGSGGREIEVRAIALHGPAAYMSDMKQDLALRKMSGTQLAQSSRIVGSAKAKRQLASGEVDARLMTAITGLAAHYSVHVVAFGDGGPGADVAPFRSAELAGTNMNTMLAALRAQQSRESQFRATHVGLLRLRSGQTVLRIAFDAPSPFGLLG